MSSNSFRLDVFITGADNSFQSRRLLLDRNPPSPVNQYPAGAGAGDNSFDANVVMVLSVLLCALICSLGLNSIIRCALRCSTFVGNSPDPSSSASSGSGGRGGGAGAVSNGIKKKALKMFPTVNYSLSDHASLPGLGSDCAICLSEFTAGEMVRLLPKCHHGFHVRCIDKWLNSHSSCPKCRHNLLETCQKIAGSGQSPRSSEMFPVPPTVQEVPTVVNIPPPAIDEALTVINIPPPAVDEALTVVNIQPLQHEGPMLSYRENI